MGVAEKRYVSVWGLPWVRANITRVLSSCRRRSPDNVSLLTNTAIVPKVHMGIMEIVLSPFVWSGAGALRQGLALRGEVVESRARLAKGRPRVHATPASSQGPIYSSPRYA